MTTIDDIRNPARKSGFAHVNSANSGPRWRTRHDRWRAVVKGGHSERPGAWRGPVRRTPIEAAQDYCDYRNGRPLVGQRFVHVPFPECDSWRTPDGKTHVRGTGTGVRAAHDVPETTSREGRFVRTESARRTRARLATEGFDVEYVSAHPNEHAGRMYFRQLVTGRPQALVLDGKPDDTRFIDVWGPLLRIEVAA